jgi:hypothetical protein
MKKEKPFEMTNATYIPNQLFDNRCKFLSSQQKIFLIFLYRRLYGYGETEQQISYSVVFNDFPCIIKNKQKFSDMIKDLEAKNLIKVERGYKKSHKYIIEEKHYNNLVYWSKNYKGENITDIETIENKVNNDFDITTININENTIEILQYVYQYEYKKIYPKSKSDFTNREYLQDFNMIACILNDIPDIHYATFIRCYFLKYFDGYLKPKIENIYDDGIIYYEKYKDILKQVPLQDDTMKELFINVCEGYLLLKKKKSVDDFIQKNGLAIYTKRIRYIKLFYCSKNFNLFCREKKIDNNSNEVIEQIKKYPVIVEYVKNILKDDCILE